MKLLKKDHPELFASLVDYDWEIIDQEHRKYSSYYATVLFTDLEGFEGNWIGHTVGHYDNSIEISEIYELEKVKQVEKVTVTKEWVPV